MRKEVHPSQSFACAIFQCSVCCRAMVPEMLALDDDEMGITAMAPQEGTKPAPKPKGGRKRGAGHDPEEKVKCAICDMEDHRKNFPSQSANCLACKRAIECLDTQAKACLKQKDRAQSGAQWLESGVRIASPLNPLPLAGCSDRIDSCLH